MAARDYADFVREREPELLRAAYLVCGNPDVGRSLLLDALVELARHWHQVRDDRPDEYLRHALYERAAAARAGRTYDLVGLDVDEPPGGSLDRWEADEAACRHAVMRALAGMGPVQRAVLVDRALGQSSDAETAEVLGLDTATERSALADALSRLGPLTGHDGSTGPGRTAPDDEVWRLLELAGDDVEDVDLVDGAWTAATEQRHRVARRTVLGLVVVGAVGVGTAAVLQRVSGSGVAPGPLVGPTLPVQDVDGIHVVLAPRPDAESGLAALPAATGLGLTGRVGPGDPIHTRVLDEPLPEALRAVYLVRAAGSLDLVLEARGARPRTRLVVLGRGDDLPNPRGYLGPRTISTDRHRIVLPSPGGVIVVDTRVPTVRHLAVPDAALNRAAWAADDATVVATSIHTGWQVDTGTGGVQEIGIPVCDDREVLVAPGDVLEVLRCSPRGRVAGRRGVSWRGFLPTGESPSATNEAGWVAGEVFLGRGLQEASGRRNGLLAVRPESQDLPVVLATSPVAGDMHRFRVLAWADERTLLFESRSQVRTEQERRVLAWDVVGDRLWRVGEVEPFDGRSWFTGIYAV